METKLKFREYMASGKPIEGGSEVHSINSCGYDTCGGSDCPDFSSGGGGSSWGR